MGLMIETGGRAVDYNMVCNVPVPDATKTYQPVPNEQLVEFLKDRVDSLFGFQPLEEQYALARKGKHMFGLLSYDVGHKDHNFALGFKNSYDMTMAIASAGGAQVDVCSNTCISGDSFVEVRRHTKNVWKTFTSNFDENLEKMYRDFQNMMGEFDTLREQEISQLEGYELLGAMRGLKVLLPQQETAAFEAWDTPTHVEFEPRNLFSLYNACTEGTKRNSPDRVFESLKGVHGFFRALTGEKVAA